LILLLKLREEDSPQRHRGHGEIIMSVFECKNCISINVPDNWNTEKKNEVANLVRKFGKLRAIQFFRPIGMDLGDAKNLALHISEQRGTCRCKTKLTEYEGQCSNCGRLNFDW
jgi:hypothetical protein